MGKNLVFYVVASNIIGFGFYALGADLAVTLFASLMGPPILLLALAVARYNRWL